MARAEPAPAWSLRPLRTPADYDACVALQRATWGDDFRELVPPAVLQIAQKMGGIAAGAFVGEHLVGFVFGLTGFRDGVPAHWSHMLAVETGLRDRGLGRALKAYQREQVLAAGITSMYWTFDPLVTRNAWLNLHHLGARVVEYVRDMYGDNPMSRTDSVIGSDRFVVEWRLSEARDRGVEGSRGRGPVIASDRDALPPSAVVHVAIPADIQALKQRDPATARAWRASTRRAFEHYLAAGYVIADFERGEGGAPAAYRLERGP
jgi:predicted GNAT superfamily acetyltransferase